MVNHAYRFVFALLGTSPIFLGFFCSGASGIKEAFRGLFSGVAVCVVALGLFQLWLSNIKKSVGHITLTPKTVSQVRAGPTAFFLAYVMPIILGNQVTGVMMFVIVFCIFLLCFFTESEANNPIVKLLGFKFYEVEVEAQDSCEITYLLMTKRSIQGIFQMARENKEMDVVQVDADFLIDFGDR